MGLVANESQLRGVAASDGIAIGSAYCYVPPDLTVPKRKPETNELELALFNAALVQARNELRNLMVERIGEKEAAIFDAHLMILDDPAFLKRIRKEVEGGQIVEQAVINAAKDLANMLAGMTNEMFAARAMDMRDVGRRILRILLSLPDCALSSMDTPSIVIAHDLTPSDTASLNPELTQGFCTVAGGLTSHSAILARNLGFPAIVALGDDLVESIPAGTPLVLDGQAGILFINPSASTVEIYRKKKDERENRIQQIRSIATKPAETADDIRVEVAANIGDLASAHDAVKYGAEGVGLLRTEFLYLDETQPPTEEKQYNIYRQIFEVLGHRPVIVRTLDIGGDKPPSYMLFPTEMNPFLGWRAIRISLDRLELFKTQLRAILRATEGYQARIMFPMIVDLDEPRQARKVVEEVEKELEAEHRPFAQDVPIGIMVETPAAAVLIDVLAEASDFFSLGTNDLTQYTLAVDRGNAAIFALYQPLHPSLLRLIKQTIDLAHSKGKWVGMCGELAGMPKAIPVLLGMGLDEFSMGPRAIPEAKFLIGKLDAEKSCQITEKALSFVTAAEIESFMQLILDEIR